MISHSGRFTKTPTASTNGGNSRKTFSTSAGSIRRGEPS